MSSQLNGCGLILERRILIKQLIDPEREVECRAIKAVLLKSFAGRGCTIDVGLFFFASSFFEKRVHLRAPVFFLQQLRPTHFARYNFVAARIVKICFQQLHVLFGLPVLLLKKTLPIVFIPHAFRLAPVAGHSELNASFSFRAKFFRNAFFSAFTREYRWLRQGLAISRFRVVTKRAVICGVLALLMVWLISACA